MLRAQKHWVLRCRFQSSETPNEQPRLWCAGFCFVQKQLLDWLVLYFYYNNINTRPNLLLPLKSSPCRCTRGFPFFSFHNQFSSYLRAYRSQSTCYIVPSIHAMLGLPPPLCSFIRSSHLLVMKDLYLKQVTAHFLALFFYGNQYSPSFRIAFQLLRHLPCMSFPSENSCPRLILQPSNEPITRDSQTIADILNVVMKQKSK